MAFDGSVICALTKQLNDCLLGARIYKIAQPEKDELLITFKAQSGQIRLVISASATLPLVYLTDENKVSPMNAPNFCMLLRKHILNGRIVNISQPSLERIIEIDIEHMDELGDMRAKTLIIELMGKHSNIIFTDDRRQIIDSIKHINSLTSSVREVLPGRKYFIPNTEEKINPYEADKETFIKALSAKPYPVSKALYMVFTGFSPVIGQELCYRADIDPNIPAKETELCKLEELYSQFFLFMEKLRIGDFQPNIIYEKGIPKDFAAVELKEYTDFENGDGISIEYSSSISEVLYNFYNKKALSTRIKQKSSDLRKIVATALERNAKKYDLQLKQIKDTEKKDKYKVYGELLNTYGYNIEQGAKSFTADNYYTGEKIEIPLDPTKSAKENAKLYFDRYGKLKRTLEAATIQAEETGKEIEHLQSIQASLDIAVTEADLLQIRDELVLSGYIKKGSTKKRKDNTVSKPFHYLSSDGFDIYVGKNNFQNDELTFKLSAGNDYWFHAKKIPGSHVILKTEGREIPDRAYEEAAALAAYYSKAREQDKVDVDYVLKKEIKKPAGANPGFVVYYTNYSMTIKPDISMLKLVE